MRVLVVDDNPASLELAGFLLEDAGFQVDTMQDGHRLVEHAARNRPDVILLDIQLPGMDGLALKAALADDPATAAIPVIAFTAHAMKGDEARYLAAGCTAYIAKPIDVATFAARVGAVAAA
jgi:two-component system, cell cycle response regulator DivK